MFVSSSGLILTETYRDLLWDRSLRGGCEHAVGGALGFDELAVYILLRGLTAARLHRWPGRPAVRRPLSLQRCQKMLRTRTL